MGTRRHKWAKHRAWARGPLGTAAGDHPQRLGTRVETPGTRRGRCRCGDRSCHGCGYQGAFRRALGGPNAERSPRDACGRAWLRRFPGPSTRLGFRWRPPRVGPHDWRGGIGPRIRRCSSAQDYAGNGFGAGLSCRWWPFGSYTNSGIGALQGSAHLVSFFVGGIVVVCHGRTWAQIAWEKPQPALDKEPSAHANRVCGERPRALGRWWQRSRRRRGPCRWQRGRRWYRGNP
mmetsp:Transcript_59949/g.167272  ORF Transcript_59949/g.167272 Transcript_59949/m.167272 type:complete len:232 (-) Transcript_59949:323-1018(-)